MWFSQFFVVFLSPNSVYFLPLCDESVSCMQSAIDLIRVLFQCKTNVYCTVKFVAQFEFTKFTKSIAKITIIAIFMHSRWAKKTVRAKQEHIESAYHGQIVK